MSLLAAEARAWQLKRLAAEFRPEVILTVAHGLSCFTAARLAEQIGVPFHLICHDEWIATVGSVIYSEAWKERLFKELYRAAASQLCASPFMAEDYEIRCGVRGSVLYPSRAFDAIVF